MADLYVYATPPLEAIALLGEFADVLAGRVAAVLADMGTAGWNLDYLLGLAKYLQTRGFFEAIGRELVAKRTKVGEVTPDVTLGRIRVVQPQFAGATPPTPALVRQSAGVVEPQVTVGATRRVGGWK